MAAVNYCIGRRVFYPPVIFSLVWAADLMLISLAGTFFYPISGKTLAIVLFGCSAFSLGGALAFLMPIKPTPAIYDSRASSRILNCLLGITVIGLPIVYRWATGFVGGTELSAIWAIRNAMVAMGNSGDIESSFHLNLITLSLAVATLACYEDGRKRKILALLTGTLMILLTGSRYSIATLMFSVFFLDWLRRGRIRWRLIITSMVAFVVFFGVLAVYLGHGDTSTNASPAENITPALRLIASYAGGGLAAFDRVVRDPGIVPHTWQIDRAVLLVLNKFGAKFDVPVIHAEYVAIGENGLVTNVYTMYFAYYDWGPAGMMLLTGFVGFFTTWLFRHALNGHRIAAILCSYFVAECVLSIFNENFFLGLNYIVRLTAISWLVYSLPIRWEQFRRFCSAATSRRLARTT